MLKNLFTTLFTLLLLGGMVIAQEQAIKEKAPIFADEELDFKKNTSPSPSLDDTAHTGTWVAVDTMHNTFGPSSFNINPLAYDPTSNIVALVHRGNGNTYAAGSGELWWNYSTDLGETWVRSEGSVQSTFTSTILGRYPSMCIYNPDGSTNLSEVYGAFSWPELNPTPDFEYLGFGVTLGFLESGYAEIVDDDKNYSTSVPIWTDNEWIYWTSDNKDDGSIRLFRTQDYTTVIKSDPREWSDVTFGEAAMSLGGDNAPGVISHAVLARFDTSVGLGGWEPGVSKSTDNGETWSDYNIIDWKLVPETADFWEIWDWKKGDEFVSYSADCTLDKDGYAHFILPLTELKDSTDEAGYNALFEFVETDAGWDAKMIADSLDDKSLYEGPDNGGNPSDPGIGQCGNQSLFARSEAGDFFVTTYIHHAVGDTNTGSYCDIFMTWRGLDDEEWATPVNLTQTTDLNETGAHLAPILHYDDVEGSYTAFLMYWYQAGVTGPINASKETVCYVMPVKINTVGISGENEIDADYNFELSQNYPNPFNPTTSIKFTLGKRANVSLKVYDILGREVANLVDGVMSTGSHSVDFNASNLSTGVYVYELRAGSFSSAKKMMLMK